MITTMKDILVHAKEDKYGVCAPNIFGDWSIQACFEAAHELKSPLIIDCSTHFRPSDQMPVIRNYAEKYPDVVFCVNLDHGGAYDDIIAAIRAGFTSVMIDRSKLPFEENIREVSEIVKIAHAIGVTVEAELGHVGQGFEYEQTRDGALTKPEEAVEYVKRTGIDCLAVAVGTSHGVYKGTPHLDFELLKTLAEEIDIPLVLHGGSSTGDENLRKAVETGIQKVNICTDLMNEGLVEVSKYMHIDFDLMKKDGSLDEFENPQFDVIGIDEAAMLGYKNKLKHYMNLFGCAGKAWKQQ